MKQEMIGIYVLCELLLAGCTNLSADGHSARVSNSTGQRTGNPEARFQQYGPFDFLGKYRIRHEWVHEDPRGSHYCHGYDSVSERVIDELGEKRPALMGMDMWESEGKLLQRSPYFKANDVTDMTRFVIGKYRPNYPGGPRYNHEALCSTSYDGIGNLFNLYLKKTTLEKMREEDDRHSKQMRFAKLLEPLKYESIKFSGLSAEKKTELVALGLKGRENDPIPWRTEEIRVPIGDTGYVYQLAFTLSDTIGQKEPEKAARRRAYWQRIQDSFRIEALQR